MSQFDFTNPFSQAFRDRLTLMQAQIVDFEKQVAILSGRIESIPPPNIEPFWARLKCAKKDTTLDNSWIYGWESFIPGDTGPTTVFDVREDGVATLSNSAGVLRTSKPPAEDKPKPPPGPTKDKDARFTYGAVNLLERYHGLSNSDVLSHGERTGAFASANVSLVSCGWLEEAESCSKAQKKDPDTECNSNWSNPIVLMYQDSNLDNESDYEFQFVLPNSVTVDCG